MPDCHFVDNKMADPQEPVDISAEFRELYDAAVEVWRDLDVAFKGIAEDGADVSEAGLSSLSSQCPAVTPLSDAHMCLRVARGREQGAASSDTV